MPVPSPRNKILPVRGNIASLNAALADLVEGEICYAFDEDQYYQKEGGVLVPVGATKAQGLLADSAIQPGDNVSELTNDAAYVDAAGAAAAAPVQSVAGKVGAVTLVKGDVGLGNVDNTSDLNKPVSTATQNALNLKADLASPALTGTPTAPTATAGTSTTQIATTAFVANAVSTADVWTRTGTTLAPKTAGDVVSVSAGTTALPGLTPVGDPNTGIYAPAADTLAVSTNGTERIRVTSNGNISQGYSSSYPSDDPSGTITGARYAIGSSSAPGFALMHRNAVNEAAGAITFGGTSTIGNFKGLASIVVDQVNTAANTANGTIRFLTNGDASSPTPAERVRITSDGKVGIGTSSPATLLHVAGTQTVNERTTYKQSDNTTDVGSIGRSSLFITGGGANDMGISSVNALLFAVNGLTEAARFDSAGRLLLGHATTADLNGALQVRNDSGNNTQLFRSSADANGPCLNLTKSRGTAAAPTEVSSGDELGIIRFRGYDGTAWQTAAQIQGFANGTWTDAGDTTDNPGSLVFSTVPDGSSTLATRMTINNNGQVFIGTNVAGTDIQYVDQRLHVINYGDGNIGGAAFTTYGGTTNSATRGNILTFQRSRGTTEGSYTSLATSDCITRQIYFGSTGTDFQVAADIGVYADATPTAGVSCPGRISFSTATSGSGVLQERLRITSTGDIQISGGGNITADFSNATVISRTYFQTTTANNGTTVGVIPNGTNTSSAFYAFNNSTPTNAAYVGPVINNTAATIRSSITGTGTLLPLTFEVGSEVARMDTSGRLLVGTSTARSNFNNLTTTALIQAEGTANSDKRGMISVVNNSTADDPPWVYIAKSNGASVGSNTLVGSTTWLGVLGFAGNDGTDFVTGAHIAAQVDGTPGANDMPCRLLFSTTADGAANPTERARITSDGYLRLAATNSLGIQFNGDTAAANALDDYEEGTFTPTIIGATTAGTATYTRQAGGYTKIGDRVCYWVSLQWTAHTGTGNMMVSGLPFTPSSTTNRVWAQSALSQVPLAASSYLTAAIWWGDARVALYSSPVGGSTAANPQVVMNATGSLYVSGHYNV